MVLYMYDFAHDIMLTYTVVIVIIGCYRLLYKENTLGLVGDGLPLP